MAVVIVRLHTIVGFSFKITRRRQVLTTRHNIVIPDGDQTVYTGLPKPEALNYRFPRSTLYGIGALMTGAAAIVFGVCVVDAALLDKSLSIWMGLTCFSALASAILYTLSAISND